MKRLLLSGTLLIAALVARADEKIEGAFGLKLGDMFNPTKAPISKFEFQDGYEFTPEKPNSAFLTYLVFITPNTHVIYKIVAIGMGDRSTSGKASQTILAILHRKYDPANSGAEIRQGSRIISVVDKENMYGEQKPVPETTPKPAPSAPEGSADLDHKPVRVIRGPGLAEREHYYAVVYTDQEILNKAGAEQFQNYQKDLLKDADPTGL